jgi:hypothetical protein
VLTSVPPGRKGSHHESLPDLFVLVHSAGALLAGSDFGFGAVSDRLAGGVAVPVGISRHRSIPRLYQSHLIFAGPLAWT